MQKMSLSEIAKAVSGKLKGEDNEIYSISTDTRTIENGSLFVCIKGENFNAHLFAQKAVDSGAVCVMAEEDVQCSSSVIYVESTRQAQLDLAEYYRNKFNIPVVGITGSVGKTTTKEMISCVMQKKFNTLKTEGNFNNDIGVPRMIFRLDESYQAAVLEMGMSNLREIAVLTKAVAPTCAVISNIGVSHIENLGSRENILKAKLEILEGMKKGSTLFVNGDDDMLSLVENEDFNIVKYGINSENLDYYAKNINQDNEKTTFEIVYNGKNQTITIPTVGIHNVYNALAAFAIGIHHEIEAEDCAEALSLYVPSGMRQKIVRKNDITFIEDCYNASPDSQKASMNALMSIDGKRHIAVIGDMLELGSYSETAHREVGSFAAEKKVDMLFTYGKEAMFSADSAKKGGLENVFSFDNKENLAREILSVLQAEDVISFKASRGMRLEEVIKMVYEGMDNNE
ncbi:MAG: UDP-N-acetylmuramoyl-tripeptide--D-alanyl-D-alanine ligase [Ruminococcaceae bacterium]|nr:UDP-N-acetylmuramoyl-tripeptide--D-alanyl-D-alanine ligase [Oscillospiraceae bacterium]